MDTLSFPPALRVLDMRGFQNSASLSVIPCCPHVCILLGLAVPLSSVVCGSEEESVGNSWGVQGEGTAWLQGLGMKLYPLELFAHLWPAFLLSWLYIG